MNLSFECPLCGACRREGVILEGGIQGLLDGHLILPEPGMVCDPVMPWFAALMRRGRESRGLPRVKVAKDVGCSEEGIRKVEVCHCSPGIDLSARLCRRYRWPLGLMLAQAERQAAAAEPR